MVKLLVALLRIAGGWVLFWRRDNRQPYLRAPSGYRENVSRQTALEVARSGLVAQIESGEITQWRTKSR